MSSSLGERTLQKNHSKQRSFGISPCLCLPQLLFGVVFQHRTMNHTPHKIGEVLTQPNRRFKQKLLEIGDGRYFRLFLMKLFWQVWNMRGTWRCFWSSSFGTFLMVSDGPCHYPKVQVSAAPHSQTLGTQQQDLVSQKLHLPLRHVFNNSCLNLWPCLAMCLTSSLAQGPLLLPFLCVFRPSSCLHPLIDMQLPMVTRLVSHVASHASRRCSADSHPMFKTNAGDLHIKYHHQEWVTPHFSCWLLRWLNHKKLFLWIFAWTVLHPGAWFLSSVAAKRLDKILIRTDCKCASSSKTKHNANPPQKRGTAHSTCRNLPFFSQWKNNVCLLFFLFWM